MDLGSGVVRGLTGGGGRWMVGRNGNRLLEVNGLY